MRKKGKEIESMQDFENDNLDVNTEIETETEDFSGGEDELLQALASLNDDSDEDDLEDDVPTDTEDEDIETDEEELDEPTEQDDEVEEPTQKKKQSKEENAKFAAQRRQEELDRKVEERLQAMREADPNYLLSQQLSELYGEPAEAILAKLQESKLQKEAQEKNLPVEILRERQQEQARLQAVESELNRLKYEGWKSKIEAESQTLTQKYTMLTQEDIDQSVDYILSVARNPDMPLTQAVYALHGEKIIEATVNTKAQDQLASQSGRSKKTPLPPSNGKTVERETLTAQEKAIAKAFGFSEADYIKYKQK